MHRRLFRSLVTSDKADQLHKVIIEISAARHFQITAVFVICAVHKHHRAFGSSLPVAGNPLVPARHKHNRRIRLDGTFKLLFKVVAVQVSIRIRIVLAVVISAPAIPLFAVQNGIAEAQLRMLGNRYIDHFRLVFEVIEHPLRAHKIHPGPTAQFVRLVGPLRHFDIEECTCFGGAFALHRNDHGLSFIIEPGIRAVIDLVNIVIDLLHGLSGIRIGIEHDLRDFPALVVILLQNPHDLHAVLFINNRVGGIKEQKVNIRLHQKLHMVPDNPFVLRIVVTVKRLAPMVVTADSAPDIAVRLISCFRILCRDF